MGDISDSDEYPELDHSDIDEETMVAGLSKFVDGIDGDTKLDAPISTPLHPLHPCMVMCARIVPILVSLRDSRRGFWGRAAKGASGAPIEDRK